MWRAAPLVDACGVICVISSHADGDNGAGRAGAGLLNRSQECVGFVKPPASCGKSGSYARCGERQPENATEKIKWRVGESQK
jgi:hypothetical protein